MSDERVSEYLESSFLAPLLDKEGITDISYNGESFFYEHNLYGRKKAEIKKSSKEVGDFLRQIANLSEKQFSYSCPLMDISFSRYRLNAAFLNLVRVRGEKSYSFSLRLTKPGCVIDDDSPFFEKDARDFLIQAVSDYRSIIIGGVTSSGKTELQKYLLSKMRENSRLIIIDAGKELEMARGRDGVDLTSWVVDERFPDSSFPSLIKNALRNDPDYIVVAESRGKEMLDAISSAMSGHPLIMTIHAAELEEMPSRMARMAMMGEEMLFRSELMDDIYHNFPIYVHLKKSTDEEGNIFRYLDSIAVVNPSKDGLERIYQRGQK
ncbi:MAG: ATPase, T2SS/T4P/T4SS family [Bacillota bacterium]|nr:ATPase, T2SS/T4P/T4SS family [Bacillota bacterium]